VHDRTLLAIDFLRRRVSEHEALLRDLVLQNSFSENKAGGDAVGARLAAALALPGLRCHRHPSRRFADHLLFETEAARHRAPVLCIGHHDTVFPPGSFEGYRREGSDAMGPGVLDMKGGLTVVCAALRALADAGVLAQVPVRFVSVGDEEVGSPESRPMLCEAARGACAALCFEAGRERDLIVTARKGTASVRAIAYGRSAHAGNAHAQGANAIWSLARFVDRLQSLTDYDRGITLNVGQISGGQSKNTVPDRAEAVVDVRFLRPEDGHAVFQALEEIAREVVVPGTRIELVKSSFRPPLLRTEASAALAQAYGACQRAAGLGAGEAPVCGGGSDASTAAEEGIPAIDGLGPRGTGLHTTDERIEVATLVSKAEALVRFLLGTGQGAN
jgi:glutamate carboxypeptidase